MSSSLVIYDQLCAVYSIGAYWSHLRKMAFQNGLLKCKGKWIKQDEIIKLTHFRASNGTAVAIMQKEWKAMHPQMYHYSKEVFHSILTSYITPKGSPLEVDPSAISF